MKFIIFMLITFSTSLFAADDKECFATWIESERAEHYTVYLNGEPIGTTSNLEYGMGSPVCEAGEYTVTATNRYGQESIHSVKYIVGDAPDQVIDVRVGIRVSIEVSVEGN